MRAPSASCHAVLYCSAHASAKRELPRSALPTKDMLSRRKGGRRPPEAVLLKEWEPRERVARAAGAWGRQPPTSEFGREAAASACPYINNRNPVCPSVTLGVTLGGLDFVSPIGDALGDG